MVHVDHDGNSLRWRKQRFRLYEMLPLLVDERMKGRWIRVVIDD